MIAETLLVLMNYLLRSVNPLWCISNKQSVIKNRLKYAIYSESMLFIILFLKIHEYLNWRNLQALFKLRHGKTNSRDIFHEHTKLMTL